MLSSDICIKQKPANNGARVRVTEEELDDEIVLHKHDKTKWRRSSIYICLKNNRKCMGCAARRSFFKWMVFFVSVCGELGRFFGMQLVESW